jgi:phosphatidylglycerophosphate synthase
MPLNNSEQMFSLLIYLKIAVLKSFPSGFEAAEQTPMKNISLFFYPCNLVGYIRLGMLAGAALATALYPAAAWSLGGRLGLALWLAVSGLILDVLDGYLARKLGHATHFGALFELTIDLLTHTLVWQLSGLAIAPLFIALEWTTGLYIAAFATRPERGWKIALVERGPWLVRLYWKPLRLNWLTGYSNVAHFIFPISLFVFGRLTWLGYLALPGLIIFEIVSVYMIYGFVKILVDEGSSQP